MPKKIAVYPGSFDPITNGHADLIDRVSKLSVFDELIVAIGINPGKPTRFTLEERVEMLETVTKSYPNVIVDQYSGLTSHYAHERGASTIIRGLREFTDFNYEFQRALMNRQVVPNVDTLFMMASTEYAHVSSTLVVEVASMGGAKVSDEKLLEMVPSVVVKMLRRKFR